MDFKPLPYNRLNTQHPEYHLLAPVWRTVDTLRRGFPAIKANVCKYLPKRPVEDDELYKLRTAKLAYSPVMSHVVHTYTGKMAAAGVDFPDNVDPIWQQIRDSNAAPGELKRDDSTLLSSVLTDILYFGRAHLMVDVPASATAKRSKGELRSSRLSPYFTMVAPLDVINWGEGWVILKQFVTESLPFSEVSTFVLFTYHGVEGTVRYKIPCQIAMVEDSEQNLYPDVHRVYYGGEWIKPDETMLWEASPVIGVGIDRWVSAEVSEDKWLCLALYNKQIQHLRIENAWTDAGYLSGTVQRVFTPADSKPDDDPRNSYTTNNLQSELAKAGNQHILIGKDYNFVESSGTALGNLEGMLDKIEEQIGKISNLGSASGSKGVLEQSGLSKKLDQELLNGTLAEYGTILIDTYNTLLAIVARLMSVPPILVGGLSEFGDKNAAGTLEIIKAVSALPDFPPLARLTVYRELLATMDLTLSPEDRAALDKAMAKAPDSINTEPTA
jgi:hypothetical protein